jgi:hypothetical protein
MWSVGSFSSRRLQVRSAVGNALVEDARVLVDAVHVCCTQGTASAFVQVVRRADAYRKSLNIGADHRDDIAQQWTSTESMFVLCQIWLKTFRRWPINVGWSRQGSHGVDRSRDPGNELSMNCSQCT